MRIVLVNMPWATVDVPSLALDILITRIARTMPDADVRTVYADLDFVDWVSEKIGLDGRQSPTARSRQPRIYSPGAARSGDTATRSWLLDQTLRR
jgi:hypothetical protein